MVSDKRILIIDDECNLRCTLALILKRLGYMVTATGGAVDGLHELTDQDFDLLFLDLKMPGMDGMKILPEIHQHHPNMRILILSANGSHETTAEAQRLGANGFLLKPLDPQQIADRVHEILNNNGRDNHYGVAG